MEHRQTQTMQLSSSDVKHLDRSIRSGGLTRSFPQTGSEWPDVTESPQSTRSHGSKQTGMASTNKPTRTHNGHPHADTRKQSRCERLIMYSELKHTITVLSNTVRWGSTTEICHSTFTQNCIVGCKYWSFRGREMLKIILRLEIALKCLRKLDGYSKILKIFRCWAVLYGNFFWDGCDRTKKKNNCSWRVHLKSFKVCACYYFICSTAHH